MSDINKVILVGRLGKDPDIRTLENGVKKASFSLATSEIYKDKDGNRIESTEWHNIICWRKLAEIAEKYLNKGKLIYLEGKLRTRSWEDNGQKRYATEIEANTFTMLGSKKEESGSAVVTEVKNQTPTTAPIQVPDTAYTPEETTDDLPF